MSYRIVVRMKAQVFYVLCGIVLCLLKSAAAAADADADASGRDYAAKPGVCPRRRLDVEVLVKPAMCAKSCAKDRDCPGSEKCCIRSNGCGRQCTPPQKDIVKPGVCPRRRLEVEVLVKPGGCAKLCDNDSDCPRDEKCCSRSNGCGRQCTPPQKDIVKPGVCPRRRLEVEVLVKPGVCAELCDNDSDCPRDEKCCSRSNGCGRQCTPPQKDIVKPGVCPRRRLEVEVLVKPGVCAELCDNDSDCPRDEKCCSRSNGCGRQCTPPQKDIVKLGVCPRRRFGVCREFCANDSDCPGNEKCCSNGCGHQCTPPHIDIVKPGVCPRRRIEAEVVVKPAVCAELCANDGDCPGNEKCCSTGCGHQCTPPYKG